MHTFGDLITALEAANVLSVDRSTILRMVKAGRLTPVKQLPGATGSYLFNTETVKQLRAETSQTQGAKS